MQIFLTNKDLAVSARELDDLRLNAECKEIVQLLCGMENLDLFISDDNVKIGHSDHPIFLHYHQNGGMEFLTEYLICLCNEYYYRFGKKNQAYFTLYYFSCKYSWEDFNTPDEYGGIVEFKPAYIKGRKGVDQIITTENVYERYKELLTDKWNNDEKEPKWTNRGKPDWYGGR